MPSLRTMLDEPDPVVATLVSNPLMAKLAEQAGFRALYLGGGMLGYAKAVLEANLNITELVQAGIDIRAVCDLPLVLDGATGFGDPMHMHRTIPMAEAAGFAAIEIEDQLVPKRAHHHVGIEHMIPAELMAAKVREAVAARRSEEFLIVARTNGIRSTDLDDALERAAAYKEAGADLLMLSPRNEPEVRAVADRLEPPFQMLVPAGGTGALGMSVSELGGVGVPAVGGRGEADAGGVSGVERAVRVDGGGPQQSCVDLGRCAAAGGGVERGGGDRAVVGDRASDG